MKCSQITVPEVNLCFHNYIQQSGLIVCFHALAVRTNLVFQFGKKKKSVKLQHSGKMQY